MAGTLTVPNIINDLPGYPPTRNPATLLDDNWQAVSDYVNDRQITLDVIANRPAAGVAGRWYAATDNGLLYVDTGAAWVQVAGGGSGGGAVAQATFAGTIALTGAYQSAHPEKFDIAATTALVVSPTDQTSYVLTSVSKTIDINTQGANGRDQVAALSNNSWAHLYIIYDVNTSTVAGLASAAAWPASLPTFPSGYTHLAYVGAFRIGNTGVFEAMGIHGKWSRWITAQQVLTDGTATSLTSIVVSTKVPPNAMSIEGSAEAHSTTDPMAPIRVVGWLGSTAGTMPILSYNIDSGIEPESDGSFYRVDNTSQTMKYMMLDSGGMAPAGDNKMNVWVSAFENPNGGQ